MYVVRECVCVCVQKELVAEEITNVQLSLRDAEAMLVSLSVYACMIYLGWTI